MNWKLTKSLEEFENREQYLNANFDRHRKDEGEATLFAFEIREEIANNGGGTIPICAKNASHFGKPGRTDVDINGRNVGYLIYENKSYEMSFTIDDPVLFSDEASVIEFGIVFLR